MHEIDHARTAMGSCLSKSESSVREEMMITSSSAAEDHLRRSYVVGDEIGRGGFGVVYSCTSSATGKTLAIKSVDKSLLTDPLDLHRAHMEATISQLASAGGNNPGVVRIHDSYEDGRFIHLVMDLCPGRELYDRITAHGSLSEPEAAAVFSDLMETVAECHRRGVAHRDIKPENILFDGDGRARLADFGSAGCFGEGREMSGLVGTLHYVAPEVVAEKSYGGKVDVWSAGAVLYAMLSGTVPFNGETDQEVFEAVHRGNLRFPTRLFRDVSPAAKDLMRRMMCKDVSRRFTADQVLGHPWVTSGGKTSERQGVHN